MSKDLVLGHDAASKKASSLFRTAYNGLHLTKEENFLLEIRGKELKEGLRKEISRLVMRDGCTVKHAEEIMEGNFFGVQDAARHFFVTLGVRQAALLSRIPWSVDVLRKHSQTHMLVAVLPISIQQIRDRITDVICERDADINVDEFARTRGQASWHLIRKTPAKKSEFESWSEQELRLKSKELVPTTRVMTYSILGYSLKYAEHLFRNEFVRCSDEVGSDYHTAVGAYTNRWLQIDTVMDDRRSTDMGLATEIRR